MSADRMIMAESIIGIGAIVIVTLVAVALVLALALVGRLAGVI